MRAGRLDKWVTLKRSPQESGDSDGFFEELAPSGAWAAIQPIPSSGDDSRSMEHLVTIRYHPQVTLDTWVFYGTRELRVRSVENVNEQNVEMRLSCEEVIA